MTLQYLVDQDLLLVTAEEVDDFITNIDDYESISLTGDYGCGTKTVTKLYTTSEITSSSNWAYIVDDKLYVKPQMFNQTTFTDGIYKLYIKLKDANFTIIQTCIFVDVTYKCKVSDYLSDLIEENKKLGKENKKSTIIHMLHYSLVNASNCGCNCEELCLVFIELQKLLSTQPIKNNCGC